MSRNYHKVGRRTGSAHPRAKIPTDAVHAMRHEREKKGKSFAVIGREFGCSEWTARDICEYKTRVNG